MGTVSSLTTDSASAIAGALLVVGLGVDGTNLTKHLDV